MKIKWTNKISGDTGYVKIIHTGGIENTWFENTPDYDEACNYKKPDGIIKKLNNICPQNCYETV